MKTTRPEGKATAKLGNGSSGGLLKVELTSDPNLLGAIRGTVERLTEAFGFSDAEGRAITRAVDEALTNIIRHAYSGAVDQPIQLAFRATHRDAAGEAGAADGLEITMCDFGPEVDPAKMCGRELTDVKPGGLGLHFIRQSMDVVEFGRTKDANCLRLVKYLGSRKRLEHS
jgi:serine/threonine-protein kinase RsbW